jgi:hypothetical protein
MSEWHYSSNGQQLGPVTSAQLKQLVGSGQLQATDMVWKDGMADWAPAGRIKGLFDGGAAARPVGAATAVAAAPAAPGASAAPVAQDTSGSQIGYYNPSAGLGERVAKTLKGFPPPSGMQGEWPLSELQLAQLKEAEKQRKAIRGFNSLCQFFALGGVLATVGALISLVGVVSGPGGGGVLRGESTATIGGSLAGAIGFTALYYLAGQAALKCRIWGPIVMTVLLAIGTLGMVGSFLLASSASRGRSDFMFVPVIIILAIAGALIMVCVKGWMAIPKFLACPLWAQEALVNAKL